MLDLSWEAEGDIFRHASKFMKDKQTVEHGLIVLSETRLTEAPSYDEWLGGYGFARYILSESVGVGIGLTLPLSPGLKVKSSGPGAYSASSSW